MLASGLQLGIPRKVSALAENGFELRESAITIHAIMQYFCATAMEGPQSKVRNAYSLIETLLGGG
jgi:hypothetical protein